MAMFEDGRPGAFRATDQLNESSPAHLLGGLDQDRVGFGGVVCCLEAGSNQGWYPLEAV
jgi:hypothetical protein